MVRVSEEVAEQRRKRIREAAQDQGRQPSEDALYLAGWTLVVTGVAQSIAQAQQRANDLAARVVIPDVRYRRDIGARLIAGDFSRVEGLGLLDD